MNRSYDERSENDNDSQYIYIHNRHTEIFSNEN